MTGKLLLKATPLVLLVLSAATLTCACPHEFHEYEGPGLAERALLGAAKRKRPGVIARITRLMVMNVIDYYPRQACTSADGSAAMLTSCDSCGHPK